MSKRGAFMMRLSDVDVARIVHEDVARRFPDCAVSIAIPSARGDSFVATLVKKRAPRKAKP